MLIVQCKKAEPGTTPHCNAVIKRCVNCEKESYNKRRAKNFQRSLGMGSEATKKMITTQIPKNSRLSM
mgnify:CR=1 FL=1